MAAGNPDILWTEKDFQRGKSQREYNERYYAEMLKIAIADGKGIEVNTSSRRYRLADATPSRKILELYRELRGRH